MTIDLCRRRHRPHRIQELRPGDEHDTRAGQSQQDASRSGVRIEIVAGPLDRADGDGVDHQPRLGAGLDREESTDLAQHRHS
jgi:hypothetical protein